MQPGGKLSTSADKCFGMNSGHQGIFDLEVTEEDRLVFSIAVRTG